MASYVSPRIIQAACSFVRQLLQTSFASAVYASFASSSFKHLAALCDFAMPPSHTSPSDWKEEVLAYEDKLSVVHLIKQVASLGPLSGDSITLALLRLIWGCSVSDDMRNVAPHAQELLNGMGVTMDNFFHVLPKHSQPIAADAECFMGDMCCADAEDALQYQVSCRANSYAQQYAFATVLMFLLQLVCGHVGHSSCMFQPVFTSGKWCAA